MQLNLFDDNRPGILLNMADEFIRSRVLIQAVSVYEQLLIDYPDDKSVATLLKLVVEWRELLSGINISSEVLEYLHSIWLRLDSISRPALRSTVLGILIDTMRTLPNPEQIFIPPRFHLGQILMEADRYVEAAMCFLAKLSNTDCDRGRFLAWRGDALTLASNGDAALRSYLAAFLDDPFSVDMQSKKTVKSPIFTLPCTLRPLMKSMSPRNRPGFLSGDGCTEFSLFRCNLFRNRANLTQTRLKFS